MISLLLFSTAAIFNATMDILENENFFTSKFKHLNQKFWYKRESWKYATKIFGWKFDSWHCAKSLMIISITGTIISYKEMFNPVVDILLYGIVWNTTFNLTYKLLKNK